MINPFGLVPVERAWHEWTPVPAFGFDVHAQGWTADARAVTDVPLVLVAGMGVGGAYWRRLGRRLAGHFRVIAPDLPGFGGTPAAPGLPWPGGPTVDAQCEHLRLWLDARRLRRVLLCGHSTGGQTAAAFAARYPDRVERLVLIAPTFPPGRRTLLGYVPRLLACAAFEAASVTPLLAFEYLRTGLPRAVQQGTRFMHDRLENRLPLVQAPTLVLAGEHDLLIPAGWTDFVRTRLRRGTLVTVGGVGHAVQYTAARVTARLVRDFVLGRFDAATSPAGTEVTPPAGTVVAPADDPRHDPLGPPQPISPTVHAVIDYALAAAALVLPTHLGFGPRARRLLAAHAAASSMLALASDHAVAVTRRVPMFAHANADVLAGVALVVASRTLLKREPNAARRTTAALGLLHIALALLTAKPTGPARTGRRA